MKATIYISVLSTTGFTSDKKFIIAKDIDCDDVMQAKGIASTISGVNFLDVTASPFGMQFTDFYFVKVSETTTYALKVAY